ncbi:MAG: hypothetical protein V4451_15240 [Pseudomonadota bacterium]
MNIAALHSGAVPRSIQATRRYGKLPEFVGAPVAVTRSASIELIESLLDF